MKETNEKLKAAKGNQGFSKAAAGKVGRIREAIEMQESQLAQGKEIAARLASLAQRREDLAAGLALGENNDTVLATVDKEIEAARKEAVSYGAIQETLSGLERKLNEANSELSICKNKEIVALRELLLSEAETLGAEYLATSNQVVKLFRRLQALDSFLKPMGYPISYGLDQNRRLSIPSFLVDCHQGYKAGGAEYLLSDTYDLQSQQHQGMMMKDIEAERQRFAEMGVDLE